MTKELRDLFLSKDIEDVDLAFTIARRLDLSVKGIDDLFYNVIKCIGRGEARVLWVKYFDSFAYPTEWRKEE